MPDRGLVEHIKKNIKGGRDIKLTRDRLLKMGFPYKDVHEAFDIAFGEMGREAKEVKKEFKAEQISLMKIITPTKAKFILPIIVLMMLLLQFIGNVSYLPDMGEKMCSSSKLTNSLETALEQNSPNVAELQNEVWGQQVLLTDDFKMLLLFNFPFMASRAYRFNPLFPAPCEFSSFVYTPRCVYYSSYEDYQCIKTFEEKNKEKSISKLFGGILPDYERVTGIVLFINSLILLSEYYIMNCFLVYFYSRAKKHMSEKKKESIQLSLIIAIILLLVSAVISYLYLLNLITLKFG